MKDVTHALPQVILEHIQAHNTPDAKAFAATFASDALLNDASREWFGVDAISKWAEKEIFGDNIRVELVSAYENQGTYIVHLKNDGDFDKTGLPDPVILTNYIRLAGDKITQLIVLLNKVNYPEQPEPGVR
ncbi:nuclear transport factor 2 family protein [Pseudomonas sp. CHM02]|uniref:nuclear transport factor 2 family protein n=1 Tax=Pseudomonas sp. CHM02 TaxID=1463662 RepID=UPI00046F85EB|nr:nuclear transport factor 2 family protein [Pseudomonas sp. CHM02]